MSSEGYYQKISKNKYLQAILPDLNFSLTSGEFLIEEPEEVKAVFFKVTEEIQLKDEVSESCQLSYETNIFALIFAFLMYFNHSFKRDETVHSLNLSQSMSIHQATSLADSIHYCFLH